MSDWSLSQLFASLHEDIQLRLGTARKAFQHPGAKGDASEGVWIEMLDTYLPKRYQAANAFVVDSLGNFSDQIDVVVFDRQYSPFIFKFNEQIIVPAESVYAVLKQSNLRQQILLLMHSEKLQVFADFIVPAFQFRMLAGHIQQNHSFQFWEGYLL
ncbi:Uncharacterised protein [Enterobacter kobei]|nr:Uncharacterised protein [Enterobacter kobei]